MPYKAGVRMAGLDCTDRINNEDVLKVPEIRTLHTKFKDLRNYYCVQSFVNRPFAASHSRDTKPPCWRAKEALGQDKQRAHII